MSTGKITININAEVSHTLYFGMVAQQIFSEKSMQEVSRLMKDNPGVSAANLIADPIKSFAYIVFAGLCNWADIKEQNRPSWEDSYFIAENIMDTGEENQRLIYTCYLESRAGKDLQAKLDAINGKQKKSPAVKKSKK